MSFNSYAFIFAFMPVVLLVCRMLRRRFERAHIYFLIAASLAFYAFLSPKALLVFIPSLGFNYLMALYIIKKDAPVKKKVLLFAGVFVDVALLCIFKYLKAGMMPEYAPGISFYTFCEIAFIAECYKGSIGETDPVSYMLLMTFFPKMLQGPILMPDDMLSQKEGKKSISWEEAYRALMLIALGMFKKVIIADTLGRAVEYGFTNPNAIHTGEALVVMLSYTLELYFDFSGYCDMAMGLASLLGFKLPLNFDSPYRAVNIIEFWKRWHITLTRFFTRYVYIPLGGNRKGKVRMYINFLIVFFISGLWHGTGVKFIIWGMMHGVLYVITRAVVAARGTGGVRKGKEALAESADAGSRSLKRKISGTLGVLATFIYVNVAWVFFGAPTLNGAFRLFKSMGELWFPRFDTGLAKCFNIPELWYVLKIVHLDRFGGSIYILTALILIVLMLIVFFAKSAVEYAKNCKINLLNTLLMSALFIWCVLSFEGVATYMYTNF